MLGVGEGGWIGGVRGEGQGEGIIVKMVVLFFVKLRCQLLTVGLEKNVFAFWQDPSPLLPELIAKTAAACICHNILMKQNFMPQSFSVMKRYISIAGRSQNSTHNCIDLSFFNFFFSFFYFKENVCLHLQSSTKMKCDYLYGWINM